MKVILIAIAVIVGSVFILKYFTYRMTGQGKGRKYGNSIADHLGMSKNFFHSVLENGVDFPPGMVLNAFQQQDLTVQEASIHLAPYLDKGLTALEDRFGKQKMIEDAKPVVAKLLLDWEKIQKEKAAA